MLDAAQRKMVAGEMRIGIAFNAVVPPAIIWLLGAAPPLSLVGDQPVIGPVAGASGVATLGMTIVITALVSGRIRKGVVNALSPERAPSFVRLIPGPLVLRAIFLCLFALALFVPTGLLLCEILPILPMNNAQFLVFNIVFGAIVGAVMAPIVAVRALVVRQS